MSAIFQYVYLAVFFGMAMAVPLAIATWVMVGSRAASVWVLVYLLPLFCFPNASWGLVETAAGTNFYTRGTGTFFFSAINLLLFGLAAQAFVMRRFGNLPPARHNLKVPAAIFGALMLGNLAVFFAMPNVYWFQLLAPSGLLNVFNLMLAFYVLTTCFGDDKALDRLVNLLIAVVALRGVWGLVRYVALGGDPANFYSNFQHINVKLTFFDINDSFLAATCFFLVVWRLLTDQVRGLGMRSLYVGIALLELFIIVFSYRRTGWAGFGLALLLLAFNVNRVQRVWLLGSYVFAGLPLLIYKLVQRSATSVAHGGASGGSLLERAFPDIFQHGSLSFTTGRFAELYAAFLSVRESPLWGLGAWGRYDGFRFSDLAWHQGDFGWMHSGVLHIALKTGLIGVVAMLIVMVGAFRFVSRHHARLAPRERGVLLAGAAGLLFMLPNWLFGTPVIEYRTMQLIALALALPYCAVAVADRRG
ncbi:O-antigen ligase family protein [Pelomonas sp. P7]|uniref:O-antigen ligase family protein n=1 Tax=Pelomonas caseinilytica TaxID=2906763 RepID=A0ABS8XIF2_9BURK|nr:O-antigen ligase family protein [Pelomonas sp. P7]MCE4538311.1 O-antigen ligase family protein [Pelomonas sp. P7]